MGQEGVMVLDLGATNVRAMVVDRLGRILAKASRPSEAAMDSEDPGWRIWPLQAMVENLAQCSRQALAGMEQVEIRGVTVTTFGVDGAPVDDQGRLQYPVISWKCSRTLEVMDDVEAAFGGARRLQIASGIGRFAFNTLYKLAWLRRFKPAVLDRSQSWVFMPSLIAMDLCGEAGCDRTMAGTSQMTSPLTGEFLPEICALAGLDPGFMGRPRPAGEVAGRVVKDAAGRFGLPAGIPVVRSGHDTQCALLGSGAGEGRMVLSSGTWEILMARSQSADLEGLAALEATTCELDARPGLVNPGMQWLGSGILEWIRTLCFGGGQAGLLDYGRMIAEAEAAGPGAGGLVFDPDFLPQNPVGAIRGLSLDATRGQIYRSALESLARKLAENVRRLESLCGLESQEVVVVGGGSQNGLWNRLRAQALGRPLRILEETETTVLGAACMAWAGVDGFFGRGESSPEAVRSGFDCQGLVVEP